MIDDVAKALCEAAGMSHHADPNLVTTECSCCEKMPDGTRRCAYWETFRGEAREAIKAVYKWHKRERRWPAFVNEDRDAPSKRSGREKEAV